MKGKSKILNFFRRKDVLLGLTFLFYAFLILEFISHFGFNVSSTVHFIPYDYEPFKEDVPPGVVVMEDGHDGSKYYILSLTMFSDRFYEQAEYMDYAAFYQRIFNPFMARVMSLGMDSLIPYMFIILNIAAILLSTTLLYVMFMARKIDVLWVYAYSTLAVFQTTIRFNMSEIVSISLFIALYYFMFYNKNVGLAILTAIAMAMTRETAIFMLFFMFVFMSLHHLFVKGYGLMRTVKAVLPLMCAGTSFILWHAIIFWKTGHIPFLSNAGYHFSYPFNGLVYFISGPIRTFNEFAARWVGIESTFMLFGMFLSTLILYVFIFLMFTHGVINVFKKKSFTSAMVVVMALFFLSFVPEHLLINRTIADASRLSFLIFPLIFLSEDRKDNGNRLGFLSIIILNLVMFGGILLLRNITQPFFFS